MGGSIYKLTFLLLGICLVFQAGAQVFEVGPEGEIKVTQIPQSLENTADWQKVFRVFPGDSLPEKGFPPMLGTYVFSESQLTFKPRFPLEPGMSYTCVWGGDTVEYSSGESLSMPLKSYTFQVPELVRKPKSYVVEIYPTADTLPANQLKLYLYFSHPMKFGQAYQHIHLLTAAGDSVPVPFLEIEQELWDHSKTRFTLWFDPGRIKRDLHPNQTLGNPLIPGHQYRLVIDSTWQDADGMNLTKCFTKSFVAGDYDRTAPDPSDWKLATPKAGSRDALSIQLSEPLEQPLLHRLIKVQSVSGEWILGEISLSANERTWHFIPESPWQKGRHQLIVDTALEDLAGNSKQRVFDTDMEESRTPYHDQTETRVQFRVK